MSKTPEYRAVPKTLHHRKALLAEGALRETEKVHIVVKLLLDIFGDLVNLFYLILNRKRRYSFGGVRERVIAYDMSLIYHPLHKFRMRLDEIHRTEKYSLNILLFKGIKNLRSIPVLIPLVKGKKYILAVRMYEISRVLPPLVVVPSASARSVFIIHLIAVAERYEFGRKLGEIRARRDLYL